MRTTTAHDHRHVFAGRRISSQRGAAGPRAVPVARRQLGHEPLKLLLAVVGVALAIALVALLLALREGINRQVTTYEDNVGADVYVGARDTRSFTSPGTAAVAPSLGARLQEMPGVAEAAPVTSGLTILAMHGQRIATLLVGFEPDALGGPWEMEAGRPPRATDELAVDRVMAGAHGIDVGDTVSLRDRLLRVVGLTDRTASWMTPIIFVTRRTANALQHRADTATWLLVRSSGPSDAQLARTIRRRLPELGALTAAQIGENSRRLSATTFNAPLMVMVLIALGIGALVIGLSAYGFVSERRREYGALKAIGAPDRRLYRLVAGQALALAIGGLLAGGAVAAISAAGIHAAWPKFLFVSLPSHYVVLVLAALGMGLAGALVPVRVLARLDPAEVFRR